MKRGDLVTVAMPGDFGKPRPALVFQADHFADHPSVTVLPVTSTLVDAPLFRITVRPDDGNRLQKVSQIMVDKITTVKRDRLGPAFGHIDENLLIEVERSLAVFLGIAR